MKIIKQHKYKDVIFGLDNGGKLYRQDKNTKLWISCSNFGCPEIPTMIVLVKEFGHLFNYL